MEFGEDAADYVVFEGNRKNLNIIDALAGRKSEDYKQFERKFGTLVGGWEAQERLPIRKSVRGISSSIWPCRMMLSRWASFAWGG